MGEQILLKQIGHDTYDGGYLDGATVTAKKAEKNLESNNTSLSAMYFLVNRFSNWKPTGTGSGLSVNLTSLNIRNMPKVLKIFHGICLARFYGVCWGWGAEVGGARIILQRFRSQMDFFRISRAF